MKIKSFKPKFKKKSSAISPQSSVSSLQSSDEKGAKPEKGGFLANVKNSLSEKVGEQKPRSDSLRVIPLGGVGDVTKNMYVYEYGEDIIIVDCGVGFPDEGMLGIDLVIPDITYLKDKKHKIKGIFITHAHEDHIGGLPYLWPDLGAPIYSQKLTCGLIKAKFTEHNLPKDQIKVMGLNDTVKLGVFEVSAYQVSHSIPDSAAVVIKTPVGTVIHQADFKMDWTPINGQVTDVATAAMLGKEGVVMMALDCLRSDKQGYNLSEKTIEGTFEKIEAETEGKMLITMTSSNFTRIQQAINVAVKSGRKLALSGRSMENNFQVARDLGYLDVPPNLVISQEEVKRFQDKNLMIIIAGAFGQPGSALSRVANGDHRFIRIAKNDSVVFSADAIPSTEAAQNAMIDSLTRLGCNVHYSARTSDLHVSGHAAAEELKIMISVVKPKYLFPIGGQYQHMRSFQRIAENLGYKSHEVFMVQNGNVIEILPTGKGTINGKVPVSNIFVDGLGVGDIGNVVLRDRQVMSEEGIVVVMVPFDQVQGQIAGEPEIISRGFVYEKESEDLLDAARSIVKSCLSDHEEGFADWRYIRHHIEENLEKFFYQETKRKPMILPVVVEV